MPQYLYVAKTKDARQIKEKEEAGSREELVARLRSRGLFIISLAEVQVQKGPTLFFMKKSKRGSVNLYDLTLFSRNLATTLSSGVTLLRSLEILAVQTESAKLEKILKACSGYIKGGLSLSDAIAKYPNVFSPLWRGIVEVGEASGNLPSVLERLADYLEMRMDFERKVQSAMVYPAIILVVAGGAMVVFFKFILPKFTEIFKQFNMKLPLSTQIMFTISQIFEKYFILLLGGTVGLVIAGIYAMKQPEVRKVWDRVSLKLPILGPLLTLTALERFTSTINILLDSGLPLVFSLEVSARGIGNSLLEHSILAVKDKVKEGSPLSDELRKLNIFPALVSEMSKIGEETGSMPEVYKKISVYYQKELSARVERLVAAFEPLMIVFMGLLIGAMVISLFLPLFKLSSPGG
jgi:type IV pilus assembly protein PilC